MQYWVGPDGIGRWIDGPASAANYITDAAGNTVRTGLPATIPPEAVPPANSLVPYRAPGVPQAPAGYAGADPQLRTNFTMGEGSGPTFTGGGDNALGTANGGSRALALAPEDMAAAAAGDKVNQSGLKAMLDGLARNPIKAGGGAVLGMSLLHDAVGAEPTPEQYGTPAANAGGYANPMYLPTLAAGGLYDAGKAISDTAGPTHTPVTNKVLKTVGGVMKAPVETGAGLHDIIDPFIQNIGDGLTKTQGQIDAERDAAANKGKLSPAQLEDEQLRNRQAQAAVMNGILGGNGQEALQSLNLGPSVIYASPQIPLPDRSTEPDYTSLRDIVDQMKPQAVNQKDYDQQKSFAMLAGLAAGLLGRDPYESFGDTLLRAGIGSFGAGAQVDSAREDAQKQFRDDMNTYLRSRIGVEEKIGDSNANFANKVWETSVKQAMQNFDANKANIEANQPKLVGEGGQVYLISTQNGQRVAKPVGPGKAGPLGSTINVLQGLGMDEKTAKATAAQAVYGDQGAMMLPHMVVGLLQHNGGLEDMLTNIQNSGPAGKQFFAAYSKAGNTFAALPNSSSEMAQKQAEGAREAMLAQFLSMSPGAMKYGMKLANLPGADSYGQMTGVK